jgi:hypothetical protein
LRIKPIYYDLGLGVVGTFSLLPVGGFHFGMFAVSFSMGSSWRMTPICLIPPLEPNPGIVTSSGFLLGRLFVGILFLVVGLERNQSLQSALGTELSRGALPFLIGILSKLLAEFNPASTFLQKTPRSVLLSETFQAQWSLAQWTSGFH